MKQIKLVALALSFVAILIANTSAQDPFGLEKPQPLPAGMTGSNPSDPRANLSPGLYDCLLYTSDAADE